LKNGIQKYKNNIYTLKQSNTTLVCVKCFTQNKHVYDTINYILNVFYALTMGYSVRIIVLHMARPDCILVNDLNS